jgi:predicted HicB family RNase H-like nuclease
MSLEAPQQLPFETRCHRVLQFARDLYRQSPDWVKFFREVVGVDGAARKVFTTQEDFIAFERSDAFHTIKRMVNALRNNKSTSHSEEEQTRVITVRLPESVHEALKAEADDHGTSMNKLCISKLLQVLEEDEAAQRARAATRTLGRPESVSTPASMATAPTAQRPLPAMGYGSAISIGSSNGTGNLPQPTSLQTDSAAPAANVTPPYRPNFG